MKKEQLYESILNKKEELVILTKQYWSQYAGIHTWYFWTNIATIIIPLFILYVLIDRKRIFEISFFGYTAHVLWANIDNILSMNNLLIHPHSLTHLLPVGVTITAVLFPVTFMLIYQFCTNYNRNFYLYAVVASIIFAFGFGGLSLLLGLLHLENGMNLFYLFLIDLVVAFLSLWLTKLFLKIKGTYV
ncbi:hypothetical protein [Halalkalibacter sp. APA_J-10(15)]|uniref:hypothetical protein n=1 Tax=unclassified Halalkalibacter TaxID=2893063 RepID=UPI001FF0ECE9|nr:hypothetical protein [Halalkalibacter sp. APA_J-10(15)]MCK0472011.1 hypothetical protein [Halalkalibacter sp. APA_J-10(15)]